MAALTLPEFAGGLPAARVDESLRLALAAVDRARECAVLWFAEVARRSLHRELGFASLELYAVEGLGFSRDRYYQFKRLAEDFERLAAAEGGGRRGEIGWTKAQQVARVATPASEARWVQTAATVGRRELAQEVKKARSRARARRAAAPAGRPEAVAADPPTTVSFRLDGLQLARYEALIERAYKLGLVPRGASREEVLLSALEALTEGGDLCRHKSRKSRSPIQIVVRRCPACEQAAVVTSHGEKRADAGAGGGRGLRRQRSRSERPEPRDGRAIGAGGGAGEGPPPLRAVRGDAFPRGPSREAARRGRLEHRRQPDHALQPLPPFLAREVGAVYGDHGR